MFEEDHFIEDPSSEMPIGYNYSTLTDEEGYLNLNYLDFFDFLPKENIEIFKTELKQCISKNNLSFYSHYLSEEDDKRIDAFAYYMDRFATAKLCTIDLCHNKYLNQYAPSVSISLQNLSTSFLLVKYRFHISEKFKEKINTICKSVYPTFSSIARRVNVSWFQPKRFGQALYTGDNARSKSLYSLISEIKWVAFVELKKSFTINFEKLRLFPPTFESYSTNIRPNRASNNVSFWYSVGLNHPDYAPKFEVCVNTRYEHSVYEGRSFSAYCGEQYSSEDNRNYKFYQYYISDIYAIYLVASSINDVAKRNLAEGNKQISKAINRAKTASVLKVRASVEQKLYYSYRFISEFTGNTIDLEYIAEFHNPLYGSHNGSDTEWLLNDISQLTQETRTQIDALFKILNDVAEYGNSKLNLTLQRLMMVITFLSLIVAILSMMGFNFESLQSLWDYITSIFNVTAN